MAGVKGMQRMDKTPLLSKSDREWRQKRFFVAVALEGPGSSERLAAELGVTLCHLLKVIRHKPMGTGKANKVVPRSWRIERAVVIWSNKVIEKSFHLLKEPFPC